MHQRGSRTFLAIQTTCAKDKQLDNFDLVGASKCLLSDLPIIEIPWVLILSHETIIGRKSMVHFIQSTAAMSIILETRLHISDDLLPSSLPLSFQGRRSSHPFSDVDKPNHSIQTTSIHNSFYSLLGCSPPECISKSRKCIEMKVLKGHRIRVLSRTRDSLDCAIIPNPSWVFHSQESFSFVVSSLMKTWRISTCWQRRNVFSSLFLTLQKFKTIWGPFEDPTTEIWTFSKPPNANLEGLQNRWVREGRPKKPFGGLKSTFAPEPNSKFAPENRPNLYPKRKPACISSTNFQVRTCCLVSGST